MLLAAPFRQTHVSKNLAPIIYPGLVQNAVATTAAHLWHGATAAHPQPLLLVGLPTIITTIVNVLPSLPRQCRTHHAASIAPTTSQ
jgi:hypothetical protein